MAGKSKKPIPPEKQLSKLVQELLKEYESWQHYHDQGGSDPTWPDGCNMDLICNHISWYKRQIKELCEETGLTLPEEYHRSAPPPVPRDYMARPQEIRDHARISLVRYEADPNYKYLLANGGRVDAKIKDKICLQAVCGYVSNLRSAIARGDLVAMRRHERGDTYIDSFRSCVERLRVAITEAATAAQQAPQEDVQLSIFGW